MGDSSRNRGFDLLIMTALIVIMAGSAIAKNIFDWRMVLYPSLPIATDAAMAEFYTLLDKMQTLGYNGIYVDGAWTKKITKPNVLANKPRVKAFLAKAEKRNIAVIPMSQSQGGSAQMDQSLRECFQNAGTPFVVQGGFAHVKEDTAFSLPNTDFEQPLLGTWLVQGQFEMVPGGRPGSTGSQMVKCTDPTRQVSRLVAQVQVKPYRTYELSVWAKADVIKSVKGKTPTDGTYFTVQSKKVQWLLKNREFMGIPGNGQWKRIVQKFNSLSNTAVQVNLNATDYFAFEGSVHFDDARIREVGLYETSANPSVSIVVKTQSGTVLEAGKDYVVGTEKLTIPSTSSVKTGDELLVDWSTEANIIHREAAAAFCYENIWTSMREQIQLEDDWFDHSRARLMKYSEWRLAGWDPNCINQFNISQMGAGPYFAATANRTADLYREANSNRLCLIFGDVYDPYHNSRSHYSATNGGILGSGNLLDTSIIVVSWYAGDVGRATNSIKFFGGLDDKVHGQFGKKTLRNRQIFSCNWGAWNIWLKALDAAEEAGLKDGDVLGIGYQNYGGGLDPHMRNIEPLQQACVAAGRWGTGPIVMPEATIESNATIANAKAVSLAAVSHSAKGLRTFRFSVPANDNVELAVFNLHGKRVATLLNEQMAANAYQRNLDVSSLASGMYFVSLTVKGQNAQSVTRKMVVF